MKIENLAVRRLLEKQYGVATVSRSIKLWLCFAEYRLFYRALLQKRPIILSILLTKATPYLVPLVSTLGAILTILKSQLYSHECSKCKV